MKKILHITFFTFGFIFIETFLFGQDFHLSQYEANPLYLNPALTGARMNEDRVFHINANYREQGGKYLGGSNKTFAAGFDLPINEKFSVGQYVIDNNSVNGSFNTFNLMLSGSYNITHKENVEAEHHNLSVGLQMGLLQKSFNASNFVYDSQYSASASGGFDQALPSGENLRTENFFKFDMNLGVFYRFIDKDKMYSPFGGFSIYHITQPNESFVGDISKTPMRYTLHGGCNLIMNKEFSILPRFLYMNQANANEINLEILGFYKMQNTDYEPILGIGWRNKDAIVFHLGLKQKNCIVRMSYDMNNSYLKQFSNGRGAFELSVIYTGKKKSAPVIPPVDGASGTTVKPEKK